MPQELARPEEPYESEAEPQRPRRPIARIVIIAVVAIILIIVAVRIVSSRKASASAKAAASAKEHRSVPVAVAPAESRDVPVVLSGLGNVQAFNTVTVKSRIDGQLVRFNFAEGQQVRAGDELALIDPRPSEAALSQVQAARFKDNAQLENARVDLQRYSDLYKNGVLPQQQYNTQQALVRQYEGAVLSDDAQVQNAKLNVSYCHIQSPINGRIGLRFVDPGNMVHAADTNGLLVITQLQPIAVLFTLPEDVLPQVAQHMKSGGLTVEAWGRDDTQKIADGRLMTIDNEIDPNTGTFRLKAAFDNKDGALYPNQFVNARLQVAIEKKSTTVPAAAIEHGAQGTYVYVVRSDDTVELRPVKVGISQGTDVVIDQGLRAGERVVTDGQDKLQNGSKIEIGGAGAQGGGGGRGGGGGGGRGGAAPKRGSGGGS